MVAKLISLRFGGTNGSQWFNDVWTYDPRTNKWSQLECIGFIPAPREGHAAALVGDVMYIFGGRTEEGNDLGDLAAFRISLRRWYTFQNMGPSPSPRSGHSMTAHEKQIVVVGGEPSSAPRDAAELSLVYILDTAKIRYPTDHPSPGSAPDRPPGNRRPSETTRNGIPQGRPFPSREGSGSLMDGREIRRGMGTPRESMLEHSGHYSRPGHPTPINGPVSGAAGGSRLPRASVSQAPSGPPPQQQAPPPRINGVLPSPPAPRSKTPTRVERAFSPAGDAQRAGSMDKYNVSNVIRESPTATEPSHANGRRTPTQQQQTPSGARPKGPEETVSSESLGRSRSQSMRQQIPAESIKEPSSTDTAPTSQPPHSQNSSQHDIPYRRSPSEDRGSHRLQQQNEALTKELEAIKNRNAWYASELALARRAGYASNSSSSPVLDKATDTFGDKEKPLLEAFLAMRSELANVQGAIEAQSALAAEKIAEVENQRDVAVSEAVYAKAKLAAHGGSQASTPQLDSSSRDGADRDVDRSVEINRRLASSLASQTELRTKLERLEAEIQGEKQARQLAENIANVAQSRIEELDSYKQRNASEVEGLRAELHEVQKLARDEAVRGAEAVATSQLSEVDKVDLQRRLEEALDISKAHSSTLSSMRDAVAASSDKVILLEKKLEDERTHRETLERKLRQLRAEHEERTEELEGMTRRLRDAEELAEAHATEARKHRDAMLSGLGKAANRDLGALGNPAVDERIKILQSQVESSTVLVRKSQAAADSASEKLRSAEERIAGLEAYQEQASREGLTLRKNLQSAIKQTQSLQAENAELSAQLANQQLEANAIAVQHGALKDLLGERGINVSELRRSQSLSRQGSGSGTPDQARLRELELQLEASVKAHTALQTSFETREQEADRAYREKLEQLENDYQSAVHYVKGTEKMLKRMKDELSKYKTHNTRLQTELEEVQQAKASAQTEQESPPSWQAERQALRDEIEGLQKGVNNSIAQLEKQMSEVRAELQATQRERDEFKDNSQHVEREIAILADQARADLEQLKRENTLLETRAQDAEQKVSLLLDQVESSVDNYRRQSRHGLDPTGANVIQRQPGGQAQGSHHRNDSALSNISEVSSTAGPSGFGPDNRNSLALDHLASELETLRSHWESTNKNYRLSNTFDFEKTPTSVEGGEISHSLANWRKRLDLEEQEAELQHEDGPRDAGRDDGHESSPRGVGGEAENNGSGQTTPRRQGSMPGMVQAGLRMDDESEDEAENSDEEAEDDKDAHGDVGDSKVTELAQRHHAGADIPGQSTSSSSSSLTAAAAASAARAAGVAGG